MKRKGQRQDGGLCPHPATKEFPASHTQEPLPYLSFVSFSLLS